MIDIGCGDGSISLLGATLGLEVVGIDIDDEAISAAKARLDRAPIHLRAKIELRHANFLDDPAVRGPFDVVVLRHVLSPANDPDRFLERARSLLSPTGRVLLVLPLSLGKDTEEAGGLSIAAAYSLVDETFQVEHIEFWTHALGIRAVARESGQRASDPGMIPRQIVDELERALREQAADRLRDTTRKLNVERTRAKRLDRDTRILRRKLREATQELEFAENQSANLGDRLVQATDEAAEATRRYEQLEATLGNQLGRALLDAGGSVRDAMALPGRLLGLRHESKKRKQRRKDRARARVQQAEQPVLSPAPKGPTSFAAPRAFQASSNPLSALAGLRVAAIMDEFTARSFAPVCDLHALQPAGIPEQLESLRPDVVFIESAWQGTGEDEPWRKKISHASTELTLLIKLCRERGIPTVFWSKEDPVHFHTFLPVAVACDFIFTTDIDCIPLYAKAAKHDRIGLLQFACQPKSTNPIRKYERRDALCFAGSYYRRYIQRQRDMDALMDAALSTGRLEIFDRNLERQHANFMFPERYKPYVVGTLPFREIDRAYKGYEIGININTIKHSQTMFARRVFELLASGTGVLSNYSRGVSLLFGDLVISSDDSATLSRRLTQYRDDPETLNRLRVMGVRKVLSEHTYQHRMADIARAVWGIDLDLNPPHVLVLTHVRSQRQARRMLSAFERQTHPNCDIVFLGTKKAVAPALQAGRGNTRVHALPGGRPGDVIDSNLIHEDTWFAVWSADDHHGEHYLFDLALSTRYHPHDAATKAAYHQAVKGRFALREASRAYTKVDEVIVRRSVVRAKSVAASLPQTAPELQEWSLNIDAQGIDPFEYAEACPEKLDHEALVRLGDLPGLNTGASAGEIRAAAELALEVSKPRDSYSADAVHWKAPDLKTKLGRARNEKLTVVAGSKGVVIHSSLPESERAYAYSTGRIPLKEIGFDKSSAIYFKGDVSGDISSVFDFRDESGTKIGYSINRIGTPAIAIVPEGTAYARLGIRAKGPGRARITSVTFGERRLQPSFAIGLGEAVVVSKQYPRKDDLYRYGFVHQRVRAYRARGKHFQVMRIFPRLAPEFWEHDDVDVVSGSNSFLRESLAQSQVRHIFVHVLEHDLWRALEPSLASRSVTVWIHGSEAQAWQRREYEFVAMTATERERQKRLSNERMAFMREVFESRHPNLHFVFVSRWLAESVMEDVGVSLDPSQYSVIHNVIDGAVFSYSEKPAEQRRRVLSIRPYVNRTYANDLSVAAILELSNDPDFDEWKFMLVGRGPLFDKTVAPLREFSNVELVERFLPQTEIAELHRQHGVFLCPSRMDSQGVSRDEAMASGLVPIGCKVGAVPEFVDDSCGFVVPPEDPRALADAMRELARAPELFRELSRAAAKRVRAQSSPEQTIERELEFLDREPIFVEPEAPPASDTDGDSDEPEAPPASDADGDSE